MKNKEAVLIISLLLCSILQISKASEVLLDINFGKKKNCLSDIKDQVKVLNGNQYDMICDDTCIMDSYTDNSKMSMLYIIQGLGAKFIYPLTTFTEPYSYIQLDISYVIPSDKNTISLDINGLVSAQYASSPTQSKYIDPPQTLCRTVQKKIYTNTLILNQQIPSGQNVEVSFDCIQNGGMVYLRSIKISKNCTPNCSKCGDATSCNICYDGYSLYSFTSGPKVCEQVGVCSTTNCFSCAKSNSQEVCLKCNSGFTLNSSNQCDANTPAPASPCSANQYNSNGSCLEYSSVGYYQDKYTQAFQHITDPTINIQSTYKCPKDTIVIILSDNNYQNFQCRCMFDNCQACSSIDSCDLCTAGMEFSSTQMKCVVVKKTQNSYQLSSTVTETGYELELVFKNSLADQTITEKDLSFTFSNLTKFTFKIKEIKDNNSIVIDLTCDENVKSSDVNVVITNSKFLSQNSISQPTAQAELQPYIQMSSSEISSAKDLKSTGGGLTKTSMSLFIIMALFCSFLALLNAVDFVGFVYFLFFLDIRYPINIQNFADILKDFQMGFFPNFFKGSVSSGYFSKSTIQFMQQPFNGYFIITSGNIISFFIVVLSVYVVLKIFSGIQLPKIQEYCKRVCYQTWEFSGIFNAIWAVYVYILGYVLIQFYSFDCSDDSCGFNYFWFVLWGLFCIAIPCLVFYLIKSNPEIKDDKYMRVKCQSLISGLKLFSNKESFIPSSKEDESNTPPNTNNLFPNLSQSKTQMQEEEKGFRGQLVKTFSKYNVVILYFRKIIFLLIIVLLHKYPYAQLAIICVMNALIVFYYLFIQPYEKKYENFKNVGFEVLLIGIQILFIFLVNDDESSNESDRIRLGWVAIALVCIALLYTLISMIVELIYSGYIYLKQLKMRRNRSKVANFDSTENHQEKNQYVSPSNDARKKITILQKLESQPFQNVKEEEIEDEEDNGLPIQSQRLQRGKISQTQLRKESSVNNLETFVDNTNVSPDVSPKRKRASRLSIAGLTAQPTQMQNEGAGESMYDIPNSNYQIMNADQQQRSPFKLNENRQSSNGKFNKIKTILES